MKTKMSYYGTYEHDFAIDQPMSQSEGETKIVVPSAVGDYVLATLRTFFNNEAGGYTEMPGIGGWKAGDLTGENREPVHVFYIAGLPMAAVREAARIILAAGQTDVYVNLATGQSAWFNKAD